MNGNKSVVKFKCVLFLEQMLVAPSVRYPCLFSFCEFGLKVRRICFVFKILKFQSLFALKFRNIF